MSGPRHRHAEHPFTSLVVDFIKHPSEETCDIIKNKINEASREQSQTMFEILQIERAVFGNAHFEQAELSHGALVGGLGGGALGASYQGLVQGIAPTTPVTGAFAAAGAGVGVLYKFFSSEAHNRKNPEYPTFETLRELELLAWRKENGFAQSADSKSEANTSGLRRRPGGK